MAKRQRRAPRRLTATAETIGAALGRVAARLDAWKRQRAEIVAELQAIALSAQAMLASVGGGRSAATPVPRVTRRKNKGGRPKGYKMSEASKRKIRQAWKRRLAAARTAK